MSTIEVAIHTKPVTDLYASLKTRNPKENVGFLNISKRESHFVISWWLCVIFPSCQMLFSFTFSCITILILNFLSCNFFPFCYGCCNYRYIENKSDHWYPAPMVVLRDVEDMNRLKISVWLSHRMNHQDMGEKWARRALLVEEMIKIFRDLDIEYRMLPQDVNIRTMPSVGSNRLPSTWTTFSNWSDMEKKSYHWLPF